MSGGQYFNAKSEEVIYGSTPDGNYLRARRSIPLDFLKKLDYFRCEKLS